MPALGETFQFETSEVTLGDSTSLSCEKFPGSAVNLRLATSIPVTPGARSRPNMPTLATKFGTNPYEVTLE